MEYQMSECRILTEEQLNEIERKAYISGFLRARRDTNAFNTKFGELKVARQANRIFVSIDSGMHSCSWEENDEEVFGPP
jgi:hypothetical protein